MPLPGDKLMPAVVANCDAKVSNGALMVALWALATILADPRRLPGHGNIAVGLKVKLGVKPNAEGAEVPALGAFELGGHG